MGTIINIGNAILILGCLFFGYKYGFDWFIWLFMLIAIGTWAYHGFSSERKDIIKAKLELIKAKTDYYKRKEK